jgi:hypothetical protein
MVHKVQEISTGSESVLEATAKTLESRRPKYGFRYEYRNTAEGLNQKEDCRQVKKDGGEILPRR